MILLDVLSIVSSSKEQKKQECLDGQSSSIIHFSDLLGTAQGITGRPQDSWFGLLPLLIGLGSLPGAAHLHSWQGDVSRRVRTWFVWEGFLSSPALRTCWISTKTNGIVHLRLQNSNSWIQESISKPRPRYISGLHGVVVTSEFYGSMPRLLGPAGRGALSALKCSFSWPF